MKKVLIAGFAVLIIFLSFLGFMINNNSRTMNRKNIYFTVEKGASLNKISMQLREKGVIKFPFYFKIYAKLKGYEKHLKSGNYILKPQITLDELLVKFQSPQSDYTIVTIPEGYSLYQIAEKLHENNLADNEVFLNLKLSDIGAGNLINNRSKVFYELEGYLFPETYFIPTGATEKDIARIMYNQFEKIFSGEYRARAKELNMGLDEITSLAALIEKEAANDEERKTIAGVIYNRLKKGMPLQIDASVIYSITKGEKNIEKLYIKDLKYKSAYNTYYVKGLPSGPIANPGKPSIEAALYPEKHDYLYYVLGETGHVFSRTYEEHRKNIEKYMK